MRVSEGSFLNQLAEPPGAAGSPADCTCLPFSCQSKPATSRVRLSVVAGAFELVSSELLNGLMP